MPLDVAAIHRQFPILAGRGGVPLVYLDNAATAQKPAAVLDAMRAYYECDNANVHRGMHPLAERATVAYERARETVRRFVNARRPEEIVFTKSCTEAINLVAVSLGRKGFFREGDRVVVSLLEHHSNIVPWLQLKEREGIDVGWMDCDEEGRLDLDQFQGFLREGNVKLVAITAQSNVLGVRPPLAQIIGAAHERGALVLVDASQSAAHHATDVQALDCDFLAFSGHKLYGPTGIGVLYGKREHLQSMPPFLGGGMMIQEVRRDGFTPADIPARFEGGTPPIAQAVGLGAAIEWLGQFPWGDIEAHEQSLLHRAAESLSYILSLRLLGPWHPPLSEVPSPKSSPSGCLSFTLEGIHPHDLTHLLGERGICLRAGHHCAQPLHERLGIAASTRLSVALYNNEEEIDVVAPAIMDIRKKLRA